LLLENKDSFQQFYQLAFGLRPAEELFDLRNDPGQINNVAEESQYIDIKNQLRDQLLAYTSKTGDPRSLGQDAPWDYYPYYGFRKNKDWVVAEKPD